MNELQTSVISNIKEIVDQYNLSYCVSNNHNYLTIYNGSGIWNASFSIMINWDNHTGFICQLSKDFEIKDIESYVILLCEIIS